MSEAVRRLAALAAGLCQDAGIGLEVRAGPWAWDPRRSVLSVDERDLVRLGPEACAGVLAVEVGRFFVSRHRLFAVSFPSDAGLRILLDALDTERAARWIRARYPGVAGWLPAARGAVDPSAPAFVQLCQGIAAGVQPSHPEAASLWSRQREARRAHGRMLPPELLVTAWDAALAADYRAEVAPRLLDARWLPGPAEQGLQLAAARALALAEREILPGAAELLERELAAVADYLRPRPEACARARRVLEEGGARELLSEALRAACERGAAPAWLRELARGLYEAALAAGAPRAVVCEGRYRPGRGRGGTLPELPPMQRRDVAPTNYALAYAAVADQIEQLVQHLGQILLPRKRLRARGGYPSGRRVDLHRLMQAEADPRHYGTQWMRSTIPSRREVSVLLLVDLSGSMSGEKARCAVLGAVLLAETLHRLETPFAIYGFQDVLIRFADFGEGLTDATREAISQMSQEVEGGRPGGNNVPSYNDDGPCVREAADLLLERSTADRVLIVVSDGEPAGRRSDEGDLRRVVAEIEAEEGIGLIALGLGLGTGHVRRFYRDSEADVPVGEFAERMGAVVERVLVG